MTEPTTPPGSAPREDAVHGLQDAFRELTVQFRRFYVEAAQAASPGMLPGTYKTLTTLARLGPVSHSALAERLMADRGLVSRQVSELESLGMIQRTPSPDDARVRMVEVTAHGRDRIAVAQQPFERVLTSALEGWPIEEIESLTSLIRALATGVISVSEAAPDASEPAANEGASPSR